jgi:hypothetical protein
MMSYYYDYYKKLLEGPQKPTAAEIPAEEIQEPSNAEEPPQVKEIPPNAVVFAKVPAAIKGQIIGRKSVSAAPAVRQSRPREALIKQYPAINKF